uniref:non-specific serine/threonine protein kinase n=1 Tax=Spongospora subterranea TaxID=70186 RepID=A0A0H5RAX7_9EUKA|eukprot:CRZ11203.1 hypothetical protein [Spongospora subterranea]
MEYCPGGDLYKEMNAALKARTKIPEARVMRWFAQIALGLNEIHNRSFMHRDIKPSNILLDAGGNAKLGDFGLTNNVGGASIDESYRGTICGTPGFLSPELERSDKYNVKSDVWALGCTLYEILALRSVFQDTVEGVFPAPIPDSYSQEVRDLLKFLLTEDMHRRPHIEDVLKVKIVHQYVRELLGSPPSQVEEALPVQCTDNAFDVGALIRKVKQGNINSAINDLRANPVITSIFALLVFMMLKILRIL